MGDLYAENTSYPHLLSSPRHSLDLVEEVEVVEKEDNPTIPNSQQSLILHSHPKQFHPTSNKQSTESTLSLTPHSNLNTSITSNHYTQ